VEKDNKEGRFLGSSNVKPQDLLKTTIAIIIRE
jgi:hypothetical protein